MDVGYNKQSMSEKSKKHIVILVPVYNEGDVLVEFYKRMKAALSKLSAYNIELLFVNDGSRDNSLDIIKTFRANDKKVSYINLSRNYGKELAMAAGFDHAHGDAIIIIDADLQDPPELIPEMIVKWEQGYDDVYAQRTSRKGEGFVKKLTSFLFYRFLALLAHIEIQKDTGDFRLLSRKALDALVSFRESERYTKGLFSLIGFKKISIMYERDPRYAGKTKWNYLKLFGLAIEGITSFSILPLRISTLFGTLLAFLALVYMVVIILKTLIYGEPVQGYPSLVSIVLFLGGVQLMSLGVIGEYIGRTFIETKRRPLYFVQEYDSNFSQGRNM